MVKRGTVVQQGGYGNVVDGGTEEHSWSEVQAHECMVISTHLTEMG